VCRYTRDPWKNRLRSARQGLTTIRATRALGTTGDDEILDVSQYLGDWGGRSPRWPIRLQRKLSKDVQDSISDCLR